MMMPTQVRLDDTSCGSKTCVNYLTLGGTIQFLLGQVNMNY